MSSIAIIQQSDAIHFITDGAQYDSDGVVTKLASKVLILPLSGCAMALRGGSWAGGTLLLMLAAARSFDEVLERLPQAVEDAIKVRDAVSMPARDPLTSHFEVTVAGWSAASSAMRAAVTTSRDPSDPEDVTGISFIEGYYRGAPCAPCGLQLYPAVSNIDHILDRTIETQEDLDGLDPELDGFALHVAQRVTGGTYGGRAVYLVGGFAELTTVRRESIASRVIHEWPDRIGAKIVPANALPVEELQAILDASKAWEQAVEAARLTVGRPIAPMLLEAA